MDKEEMLVYYNYDFVNKTYFFSYKKIFNPYLILRSGKDYI
jgi:hypothetical protein